MNRKIISMEERLFYLCDEKDKLDIENRRRIIIIMILNIYWRIYGDKDINVDRDGKREYRPE